MPPSVASRMLSVSSWRMMRERIAPEGGADGHLRAAAHAADEKQVGDVGAGDEKTRPEIHMSSMQMRGVFLLHGLNAGAAGGKRDVDSCAD